MNAAELTALLPEVVAIAKAAGVGIMDVYGAAFEVETKGDGSPLTIADRCAHMLIEQRLAALTPGIPVLSEESRQIDYSERAAWPMFWLVDPLDGTKEFVKRNGEFTVNIALIDGIAPCLGVVHTPAQDVTHSAATGCGAYRQHAADSPQPIRVRAYRDGTATVVASRSHAGEALQVFNERLRAISGAIELLRMGSALKLCLVAQGDADIYPRLGPTSEWDTAAAQCVVEVAGGHVVDRFDTPLRYNKKSLLNPWFLVYGATEFKWCELVDGLEE
ncbi:MAG: 3'(2'),5'-bisphosphate nucleotidase CysQ [Gammaproteobacteria bacterium]|nr:3'(2'),5'-bisphosphate nucleotidase CysQ [Gammaproteobacteria bacterium]MDH3464965.1 3'(2'),5'-bisphosphate nucleotidase CysQ [Gammaproteobacteria bacterium]